jgi:hypothetical protein
MITLVAKRLPATTQHRHLTKDNSKPRGSGGLVKLRRAVLVRSQDEDDLSGQGKTRWPAMRTMNNAV